MAKTLQITAQDKKLLMDLLTTQISGDEALGSHIRKLENEINKATVIQPDHATSELITMNSRVSVSLDGLDMELTLVYPEDADVSDNRASILSPIGTALLGYREGDVIQWEVPSGITEILVKKVLYQPESAWADAEEGDA